MDFARACAQKTGAASSPIAGAKGASGSRPTKFIEHRAMMRPYDSLRGRREFVLVLRRGERAGGRALTVSAHQPSVARAGRMKVGIIVPSSVGGAVVRNRLRRRCKAILDAAAFEGTPYWYVVQCRPEAKDLSFDELREYLTDALKRLRQPKKRSR